MYHVASVSPLYRSATIFFFFFPPPRGKEQKSPTHFSVGRRPNFFCLMPPRGKEQKSSTHCSTGPRPNFCLFHATLWHSANVLRQHTALSVLDRIFTFSTPLRGTPKDCDSPLHRFATETLFFKWKFTPFHGTKKKVHELPKLCNRSSTETNNSSNDLIYQTSKKKQA